MIIGTRSAEAMSASASVKPGRPEAAANSVKSMMKTSAKMPRKNQNRDGHVAEEEIAAERPAHHDPASRQGRGAETADGRKRMIRSPSQRNVPEITFVQAGGSSIGRVEVMNHIAITLAAIGTA